MSDLTKLEVTSRMYAALMYMFMHAVLDVVIINHSTTPPPTHTTDLRTITSLFLSLSLFVGKVGGVPADVADQIASMQKALDGISTDVSAVSLHTICMHAYSCITK